MTKGPVHKQSSNGLTLAIWDNSRNDVSAYSIDIQRRNSAGEWEGLGELTPTEEATRANLEGYALEWTLLRPFRKEPK